MLVLILVTAANVIYNAYKPIVIYAKGSFFFLYMNLQNSLSYFILFLAFNKIIILRLVDISSAVV